MALVQFPNVPPFWTGYSSFGMKIRGGAIRIDWTNHLIFCYLHV